MSDQAVMIDGFQCYAPALALGSDDYPVDLYDRFWRLEENHFWFRARNRILLRMFRQYLKHRGRPRVLEIGCGTGYVLKGLAAESRYDLTASDVHVSGLRHARRRVPAAEFVQADARDLPYNSDFDAIGAFDVIEHINEDLAVLQSIHRSLKPGGIFLATVPQHMWLWSATDELALHKRRYSRQILSEKLKVAGFEILQLTSFVTALLPAMFVSRFVKRSGAGKQSGFDEYELELSPLANAICSAAMRVDEACIGAGLSLPAGGSLLAVARK
jgi:SAM-dependent methyltransferase